MIEYVIIFTGVSIFGIQHSGISSLRVKEQIIDRWGKSAYGNLFNLTSAIAVLIAFLSMNYWDWLYFIFNPALIQLPLFLLGIALIVTGVVIASAASKVISVSTVADMRTDREPELITNGIYAKIRHPLYLATILMFAALAFIYPFSQVIFFSFGMSAYTLIGAYLEERKLIHFYGERYLQYKRTAGFITPHLSTG